MNLPISTAGPPTMGAACGPFGRCDLRVLIISGSVGAGHDGVAQELATRLRSAGAVVDRRDYLQALPRWAVHLLREGYSGGVNYAPSVFEGLFGALEHAGLVRRTAERLWQLSEPTMTTWIQGGYDVVVTTYPFASHTLGQLRAQGKAPMPLVTILTDPAVHRFWVHPQIDHHLTITEATARQGQEQYGIVMTVVGPLVPSRFGDLCPVRRADVRAALGFEPGDRVALMMTGSLGLGDVQPAARAVARSGVATPLVLCGRNQRLRRRLARLPGVLALGWREDVADLMNACDVLVHNAGGLSLTEALVAGLPAVSFACLPGHGRANAALLERAGLAPWARTLDQLPVDLASQLSTGRRLGLGIRPATDVVDLIAQIAGRGPRYEPRRPHAVSHSTSLSGVVVGG